MAREAVGRNNLSIVVEKMSSSLIMQSPNWVAIFLINTGEIVFANENFLENSGYLVEEVLGESIFNLPLFLKHPSLAKEVGKLNGKSRAVKSMFKLETLKQGTREGFLSLLLTREKGLKYVTFIFDDRTDLIRIQNQLKESEERYRGIFENVLAGVYFASVESGEIMDCNEYFARTMGFTAKEQVIGQRIPGLLELSAFKNTPVKKGKTSHLIKEIPLKLQNDRLVWLKNYYSLNGAGKYIEGVIIDITRKKEIEDLQKTSEFRYRTLIENATDYKFIVDEKGYCQYTSPSVSKMLGYSGKYPVKNIFSLIADKDTEKFNGFLTQVSHSSEKNHKTDILIKHRKGSFRMVHIVAKNLLDIPKIWGIIINAEDITDKIKAQQEMGHILWKEQELNRQKSQFISTVSHDFRTPLTNISLNTQLLERYVEEQHCDHIARNVERIKNAAKRLTALVNEVSLVSKEQSGRLVFNPEIFQPSVLLEYLVEQVDYLFHSNVEVRILEETKDPIKADRLLLAHIADNLLGNALKFSPGKSPVNFTMGIHQGGKFKLVITDNGIGIPRDELRFIFDPYFRATNAGKIKGNGIGLSIVKSCVALHHGTIKYQNRRLGGTKVRVEIPLNS